MNGDTISVVIPVHNAGELLEQCLDSVAGQTLRDLEIICVDDGSTDRTPAILSACARRDARFRILRQVNAGPGAARNRGLDEASGAFVLFLDADDWFEPRHLERMTESARRTGADVTICRADTFDTATGRSEPGDWMLKERDLPGECFAPEEIARRLFQFTYGMAWDKLYSARFIRRSGIRFPPLRNSEDLAFVYPSLMAAGRIGIVPEVLVHHRINRRASVSNTRSLQPRAPYLAARAVGDYLTRRGLWERYGQSYLNWAMEFLVWHVADLADKDAQRQCYRELQEEWLPAFPFAEHPASYYDNRAVYAKYRLARRAPWPVFTAALRAYRFFKRGGRHGH